MARHVQEMRLPGIGTKYVLEPEEGGRLTLIIHNDGRRELFLTRRPDEPPRGVALSDDEAREFAAAFGGAWQRPRNVEDLELALGELSIEWIPVPDDSPLIGKTLAEARFRSDLGVTVIAILREPQPITGAQPHDTIERGDVLVTVAKAGAYPAFRERLRTGK